MARRLSSPGPTAGHPAVGIRATGRMVDQLAAAPGAVTARAAAAGAHRVAATAVAAQRGGRRSGRAGTVPLVVRRAAATAPLAARMAPPLAAMARMGVDRQPGLHRWQRHDEAATAWLSQTLIQLIAGRSRRGCRETPGASPGIGSRVQGSPGRKPGDEAGHPPACAGGFLSSVPSVTEGLFGVTRLTPQSAAPRPRR